MNIKTIIPILAISLIIAGCNRQPPNIPQIQTIEPSQTAFVIPLEGQTSNQGTFDSEAFLENSKVATKRITIPMRWRSKGRAADDGEYIPTVKVIVVDRAGVGRHWEGQDAIEAESRESIGFSTGLSASAQINSSDAARFLYRYNN